MARLSETEHASVTFVTVDDMNHGGVRVFRRRKILFKYQPRRSSKDMGYRNQRPQTGVHSRPSLNFASVVLTMDNRRHNFRE